MALYIDVDELKATLQASGTTYLNDDAERVCLAASEGIDLALGRTFGKDTEDVTRVYTALDPWLLKVNDLVEVTTLKTDEDGDGTYETTWTTSDYYLDPVNAEVDEEPFTAIYVHPNGEHRFPTRYPKGVQVVGRFGWPKVPAPIREAAGLIAEQLVIRRRTMPMGFSLNAEAAAYVIRSDPQLAFLLKGLGRRKLVA